jgi:hypothetical protein
MKKRKVRNKGNVSKVCKKTSNKDTSKKTLPTQYIAEALLSGEKMLICTQTLSNGGRMSLLDISELSEIENFQLAYNFAIQSNVVELGIRRQRVEGRGLLNMMYTQYRREIGLYDMRSTDDIVFNWFTMSELRQAPTNSPLFANINNFKPLTVLLSQNCDMEHEFPCLFSGVPNKSGSSTRHLLFLIKDICIPNFEMDITTTELFI